MDPVDEQKLKAERDALDALCFSRFGVHLLLYWQKLPSFHHYRPDTTCHGFLDFDGKLTDDLAREIRRWIEDELGLQFSCQHEKPFPGEHVRRVEYVYIGHAIPVPLEIGYHVTRRANLPFIWKLGLLPSTPDRQNTDRHDCEGNIYLCRHLGSPRDADVKGSQSAYFWRDLLAKTKNRFDDTDWVILEVDLRNLANARTIRDMWSESGIVLTGIERLPSDRLRLIFEDEIVVSWDPSPVPLDRIYGGLTPDQDLIRRFPKLGSGNYVIRELPETGASARYNCKAYAAGFSDKYLLLRQSLDAEKAFFATQLAYRPVDSPVVEPGAECIAIYTKDGAPSHVARQIPGGRWISKIGAYELLEHDLDDLTGDGEYEYGRVAQIMSRPYDVSAGT